MDPIQSWLDADEVRKMAENLLRPVPELKQKAEEAGYDEDFVGFTGNGESSDPPARPFAKDPPSAHPPAHPVTPTLEPTLAQQSAPAAPAPPAQQAPPQPAPVHTPPAAPVSQPHPAAETSATPPPVSQALEQAQRVAQDSGIITPSAPPTPPSQASGTPAEPGSPFQVSTNQSHEQPVPMASVAASPDPLDPLNLEDIEDELPSHPHEVPARGPFLMRLTEFSQLLRNDLGARAMFLIDEDGQILLDEIENSKLIQVARTLATASRQANQQTDGAAAVGNLHVKIGANSTLEIIPCPSQYGLLILGVVLNTPLGAERVKQVADHLHHVIEPTS